MRNDLEHTNPWQVIDAQRAEIEQLKRDLEAARDIIQLDVVTIDDLQHMAQQLQEEIRDLQLELKKDTK